MPFRLAFCTKRGSFKSPTSVWPHELFLYHVKHHVSTHLPGNCLLLQYSIVIQSSTCQIKSSSMQMTLNSGKMILALMKSPQKNLFNREFLLFPPCFCSLTSDFEISLPGCGASQALPESVADQIREAGIWWEKTQQMTSEDLMPQRSAPAFTFGVGALILTGSCECLCLRLREWRIAGLIASSRLNDRRSQNFWTCHSPLCLLKLFFEKLQW